MDESLPLDALNVGRAWYQNKNYARAVAAFTQAIEDGSGFMALKALDNRAATYEKLGELNKALKDAKSMIELMPDVSKGYLRCGKVLQLKNEAELAFKIYERGLKKVKVGKDVDRTLLQGMFSKLQRKLSPPEPKYYDPLVRLPVELAAMVCFYISMRDRVVCLCVSKPWKRFLESSHDLWKDLELFHIRKQLSRKSLRSHCRRSNYTLTTAMINVAHFESSKLNYLLRACKQLERLEFRQGYLGDSLTEALPNAENLRILRLWDDVEIPLLSVGKVLRARPGLEVAEFNRIQSGILTFPTLPQLEALISLTLAIAPKKENDQILSLDLPELVKSTPNLKSVALRGCGIHGTDALHEWTKLKVLDVSLSTGYGNLHLPSSLVRLNFSQSWMQLPYPPIPDTANSSTRLPLLESLNCESSGLGPHLRLLMSWIAPSIDAGNLKSLNLGDCSIDEGSAVDDLIACDSLIELSLKGWWGVPESDLINIVRKCPKLRRLDLSKTKVTGVLVKEVMTREEGPLQFLGLVDSTKISYDAIEWARSLGSTVQTTAGNVTVRRHFRDRIWE